MANTKQISTFFVQLRREGGAIWLENGAIKLSTPKKLQTAETKKTILDNKTQILSVLEENKVFSKERFLHLQLFKNNVTGSNSLNHAQQRLGFMSKAIGRNVKMGGLFRIRPVKKTANIISPDSDLVQPYHTVHKRRLAAMIFIHPGHGGAEVYQHLADELSSTYNCIGIDNYNIHHNKKISSLNKLAHYYLSEYKKKYRLEDTVNLLGWSLGGQVALEMAAILEAKGFKKINIFLLDTFITGKIAGKISSGINGKQITKKQEKVKTGISYHKRVTDALETEIALANSPVSERLLHANVVLFKATMQDKKTGNKDNPYYVSPAWNRLKANNIDRVTRNLEVIKLKCDHKDILSTNSITISNYILSGSSHVK